MIKFFNVRSGETVEATTEPMIAAYLNSSDQNPNGIVQDFGWRVAPDTLKRVRDLQSDEAKMEQIATRRGIPLENIAVSDLLHHISNEDARKEIQASQHQEVNHAKEYEAELRKLDEAKPIKTASGQTVATPAEIEAQAKKDEAKLAAMVADDSKKADNKTSK